MREGDDSLVPPKIDQDIAEQNEVRSNQKPNQEQAQNNVNVSGAPSLESNGE